MKYANVINPHDLFAGLGRDLAKRDQNELFSSVSANLGSTQPTIEFSSFGIYFPNDSSASETNDTLLFIQYGDDTLALGSSYSDVLELDDEIPVDGFIFGVANLTNSSTPVLGIGLEGLESTNSTVREQEGIDTFTYPNLPIVLVENGIIAKRAYSLFFEFKFRFGIVWWC